MKYILAIETSCDDTSIAIMKDFHVLSVKTHSQIEEHVKFGGVIPELASRYHSKDILNLINLALADAGLTYQDLDTIAVTSTPGLVNTLQVGLQVAKTLSQALEIPLYEINHIEAHIWSPFIGHEWSPSKALIVVASGGHTQLIKMDKKYEYDILGTTRDDAIGEAYDKVAKILKLGYPGGPVIDKIFQETKAEEYLFKTPKLEKYDMSFSGLKSKVLQASKDKQIDTNLIASSFQYAAMNQLLDKIKLAIANDHKIKHIVVGGGVSANTYLRDELKKLEGVEVHVPKLIYTGDNAAMIGYLCYMKHKAKKLKPAKLDIDAKPRSDINGK